MKTKLILAVAPAIIAITALLLSIQSSSAAGIVAGYFCVAGVSAIMALDYRLSWNR